MATTLPPPEPVVDPGINLPSLERSLRKPRTLISALLTGFVFVLAFCAMIPLFSVLYMLMVKGGGKLLREGYRFFTELPPAAGMEGGGIGNAVLGTLLVVGTATAISVPIGIMGAIFLA